MEGEKAKPASTPVRLLPIAEYKEGLVDAVSESDCVVVIGETGSGKTTQLPQYLLAAGLASDKPIVVTQPRRIAAISVAQRVASELNTEVGDIVGYEVRFERVTSSRTKIKFVTDGCLVRECMRDPSLSSYSVVILDEAHVRSIDTDILFGLCKRFVHTDGKRDPDRPKVVVMSATLESHKFSKFFGAKVFRIPGRTFPVEITAVDAIGIGKSTQSSGHASKAVDLAMKLHCTKPSGDILVFLTGRQEIESASRQLFRMAEDLDYDRHVQCREIDALLILPMYGSMSTEEQRRVFKPGGRGVRKLVLATDIASTSLTIDGIVYVVDSGFVKQKSFNPNTGLDALQVVPISRSEASQRAGRAGRTKAGECYRLYSKEFEEEYMLDFTPPEIQRTSLTSTVLTLKTLGIGNVLEFPYVDPPEERMLLEALRQLYYYDALDKAGNVSDLGKKMGLFPLPPSLSRVLLFANDHGCEDPILSVVAMMCVEQIFIRPGNKDRLAQAEEAQKQLLSFGIDDFTNLLLVFDLSDSTDDSRSWCRQYYIHWRAISAAHRIRKQLDQILSGCTNQTRSRQHPDSIEEYFHWKDNLPMKLHQGRSGSYHVPMSLPDAVANDVRKALCYGYFNNVARRQRSSFVTMDGHATMVLIHPSSSLFEVQEDLDWVMFAEVVWTSKAFMRTLTPIKWSWVKDLIPKLHEVNVHQLSTTGEIEKGALAAVEAAAAAKRTAPMDYGRRNDDAAIAAARERYLARKRARVGDK